MLGVGIGINRPASCSAPGHYLNQYWLIFNYTTRNTVQLQLIQNYNVFHTNKDIPKCLQILAVAFWIQIAIVIENYDYLPGSHHINIFV